MPSFLNYLDYGLLVCVPKTVCIENQRLGVLLRLLQLLILWVFLRGFIQNEADLYRFTPLDGFQSFWTENYLSRSIQHRRLDDKFCQNASNIEYHWDQKEYVYKPEGCTDLMPGDEAIKGESTLFVPTFFRDQTIEQRSGDQKCDALRKCCEPIQTSDIKACKEEAKLEGSYAEETYLGKKTCTCTSQKSYFIRGANAVRITISAGVTIGEGKGRKIYMAATKKDNILTVVEHYRTRRKKHNVSGKALLDTQDTEGRIRPASAQRHHKVPLQTSPVTLSVDSSGYIFNASKSNQGAMRREPLTLATHEYAPNVSEVIQRQRYVGDVVSNEDEDDVGRTDTDGVGASSRWKTPVSSIMEQMQRMLLASSSKRDEQPKVSKRFEPGSLLSMTLEEWLQHAEVVNENGETKPFNDTVGHDSLLDVKNKAVRRGVNGKDDYPPFRLSGMELDIELKFFNKQMHSQQDHDGTLLQVRVLGKGTWQSRRTSYQLEPFDPHTGDGMVIFRTWYGVTVRFRTGGTWGTLCFFPVLRALSALIVYLQLPGVFVGFLAMYVLGPASNYYMGSSSETLSIKKRFTGLCARGIGWGLAFQARQGESDANMSWDSSKLADLIEQTMRSEKETSRQVAEKAASMMIEQYGSKLSDSLSVSDLCRAALESESMSYEDASPLYEPGTKLGILQRILLPQEVFQEESEAQPS